MLSHIVLNLDMFKMLSAADISIFPCNHEHSDTYMYPAVLACCRYPTREWHSVGVFTGKDTRTLQAFQMDEQIYTKYIKVEMLSHFGQEHYCPLSVLRYTLRELYTRSISSKTMLMFVAQSTVTVHHLQKIMRMSIPCFSIIF